MENLLANPTVNVSRAKRNGPKLGNQSRVLVVLTNENIEVSTNMKEGKLKHNPFFFTLIIGDKLLHNTMIDSGASTTVMP